MADSDQLGQQNQQVEKGARDSGWSAMQFVA